MKDALHKKDISARERIGKIESAIKNIEGHLGEDPLPLKHTFVPGMYAREITVPKGMLVVTKIHKQEHLIFMLKGEVSVYSEEGVKRITAPAMFVSPVGEKRVVYVHEETVWINVHHNPDNKTDLKELEDCLIAKTYDQVELPVVEVHKLEGGVI